MADRVIPNSLNYADIKPEAVESEIKLIKFTPQTSAKDQKGGDLIKFLLTGNGFLDPYSTSFRFTVEVPFALGSNEIRFLDRSAHSFINRLIIRSQGVELERIQDYDVVAAMIHDVIYSPEQNQLHHWEGFPSQQAAQRLDYGVNIFGHSTSADNTTASLGAQTANVTKAVSRAHGVQLVGIPSSWQCTNLREAGEGEDANVGNFYAAFNPLDSTDVLRGSIGAAEGRRGHGGPVAMSGYFLRAQIGQLLMNASSPMIHRFIGEIAFGNPIEFTNKIPCTYKQVKIEGPDNEASYSTRLIVGDDYAGTTNIPLGDVPHILDLTSKNATGEKALPNATTYDMFHRQNQFSPFVFGGHVDGRRIPCIAKADGQVQNGTTVQKIQMVRKMTFIIPIYSGLIGVLQPDKKLIPLNLIPLDIEIMFNPHALYSSSADGSREYRITEFNMYSHMIFFESEIHRSLEAAVAEHGIFLYCNGFHQAPTTLISSSTLPSFAYISMNLKSINSVHLLFYYTVFETRPCARKLHFVSHNITSLQLLNGTQLIPPEAIQGNCGTSIDFSHLPFLVSMYQSWNKLHDPKTDGAISAFNYCSDLLDCQADPTPVLDFGTADGCAEFYSKIVNKQQNVGRCQYGISLEGEELGVDKTMVTGRKSQYPFLVYMKSDYFKRLPIPSYMVTFLRADYIVYLRPDLQIVVLGK